MQPDSSTSETPAPVKLIDTHGTVACYNNGCRCDLCRAARTAYGKAYRASHGERRAETNRKWASENQEKLRASNRAYYLAHKDKVNEKHRAYYNSNKKKQRDRHRAYYCSHRAEEAKRNKSYYYAHRDEYKEWNRKWYYANQDKVRPRLAAAHAARRAGPGAHYTAKDVRDQLELQQGLCRYCVQPVTNHHVDHFIPLSRGGDNTADNIVISCPACNLSKGAKLIEEWYPH